MEVGGRRPCGKVVGWALKPVGTTRPGQGAGASIVRESAGVGALGEDDLHVDCLHGEGLEKKSCECGVIVQD